MTVEELEKEHNIKLSIKASHAIGSTEIAGLVLALASALGVSFVIDITENNNDATAGNIQHNNA